MRCNPLLIVWHTWYFHSGLNNFFISRISFPGLHDSFGWRELRSRIIQMQTIYGNMDEFHINKGGSTLSKLGSNSTAQLYPKVGD